MDRLSTHGGNMILVGFMGAGKSSVGRLLARRLGRCLVETDDMITAAEGRSIPEIFAAEGEAHFRALRTRSLRLLALKRGRRHRHGRRAALPRRAPGSAARPRHGRVALRRLRGALRARPAWRRPPDARGQDARARREALYEPRKPFYAQADLTVDTTGLRPDQVAGRIAGVFALP